MEKLSPGYYVKQAFKTTICLTILFRAFDATTDFSLLTTYLQNFDTVIQEFLKNTLCTIQPNLANSTTACSNVTFVKNLCLTSEDWSLRLVCYFPLMKWWIPGTLSACILLFTYLVEVATSLTSPKFDHYFEMFSGVCCRKHNKGVIILYSLILPLSQQMTSLIYGHCVKTFVSYWKGKNKEMVVNVSKDKETCIKHCAGNELQGKRTCMVCCDNVQNSEMLDELNDKAEEVTSHGQKLISSTENLLMPMVQFSFLFPVILIMFCPNISYKTNQLSNEITTTIPTIHIILYTATGFCLFLVSMILNCDANFI